MKSWKTTLGGLLASLGTLLASSTDATTHQIGVALAAIGALLIGVTARDNDKTSEDVGAK